MPGSSTVPADAAGKWLDSTQAAEHMNVKLSWLYDHGRHIKHYKAGKKLLFRIRDLDTFIESNAVEPVSAWHG